MPTSDSTQPTTQPPGSMVVVELFTSEGCSSCPPADQLLADIRKEAQERDRAVYPIAFHVDYWNRLGWEDRFSSAAASARQQRYARAFHTDNIYTPQMIVQGKAEFVGSDRDRARREIDAALVKPSTVAISLSVARGAANELKVDYSVASPPHGTVLNLIAVEADASSNVRRGENAGRVMHHVNVARAMTTVSLDETAHGTAHLSMPADAQVDRMTVIAYAQDSESMIITGAAASMVPAPNSEKARP